MCNRHREESASHRTGIPIAALDISPNKSHAILAGREILKTIRVNEGRVTEDFNLRSAVTSYASTRGGSGRDFQPATDVKWSHTEHDTKIATAASNGRIVLYDLTKPGVELARLHEHDRQVHRLAFNPFSAAKLLSGSQDGTVRLWDLRLLDRERGAATMQSQHVFQGRSEAVRDVKWSSSDGFEFALGTDGGSVQLWDFRNPSMPRLRINAHEKPCTALDWHPDGKHLASGGLDKDVKIWDFSNPNGRQKPSFVLRVPQGITRVRWRPACWSWEIQETGDWQCTQLVTSYNQEDSRIHIWDLQRPHIPFREIDRSRGAPTDLLWHSKDLLWTVGNEGNFMQTDTKYAPQVIDQLNSCHINFMPDGGFLKISERRLSRSGLQEASESFLNQRRERGSDSKSRSWTDDEASQEGNLSIAVRRRQPSRTLKFPKSQGNTPPSRDEHHPVVPLERALKKGGPFANRQIGLMQEITGASLNNPAFRYLAQNYAEPMSELERREEPTRVVERLEAAFSRNADACTDVAMYRLAQTWRVLGAVIIPELAAWAENNRKSRLASKVDHAQSKGTHDSKSGAGLTTPLQKAVSDKSFVFSGATSAYKGAMNEHDQTTPSNTTTPLARPLPDSALLNHGRSALRYSEIDEAVDVMAPLPESVLSSHNTAAAASQALLTKSPPSKTASDRSPYQEHRPTDSIAHVRESQSVSPRTHIQRDDRLHPSSPQAITTGPEWSRGPVLDKKREEEKRAALRDYRAQSRPVLNLENPGAAGASRPVGPDRHDSAESFAMFSTSMGSSLKTKSVGRSLDSPQVPPFGPSESWKTEPKGSENEHGVVSPLPDRRKGNSSQFSPMFGTTNRQGSTLSDFSTDSSGEFQHRDQGSEKSLPRHVDQRSTFHPTDLSQDLDRRSMRASGDGDSPSDKPTDESLPFDFEPGSFPLRPEPISDKQPRPHQLKRTLLDQRNGGDSFPKVDVLSPDLIYPDFRPMDVPERPGQARPGWDSYSFIAAAMEFDLTASHDNPTCQFTAHLSMHISPFFKPFASTAETNTGPFLHRSIGSRLRYGSTACRIAESALSTYLQSLVSHEMYTQAAEVRRFAHATGYTDISRPSGLNEGSTISQEFQVYTTCGNCGAPLGGRNVGIACVECHKPRDPCPLCLCYNIESGSDGNMWTTCQGCGHGGHVSCHSEWLSDPELEGSCPTPSCWHDCGPGRLRQSRLQIQNVLWGKEASNKGAKASTLKDSWAVSPSPAVGRARKVLREPTFGSPHGSNRKQVRLLAPGETSGGITLSSSH